MDASRLPGIVLYQEVIFFMTDVPHRMKTSHTIILFWRIRCQSGLRRCLLELVDAKISARWGRFLMNMSMEGSVGE